MLQHLLRANPLPRIELQHRHQQVDAQRPSRTKHPRKVRSVAQRHDQVARGGHIPVQRRDTRPILFRRRADSPADELYLVDVGVAGHEGRAQDEFGKDGAHGPDVHGAGVVAGLVEELGRAVPARDDVVRHGQVRVRKGAGEPEVGQLDGPVAGDEQVVRLDVAVQDVVGVAEPYRACEHGHPCFYVRGPVAHAVRVADEHLEIAEREEFEHEVEVLVLGGVDGV